MEIECTADPYVPDEDTDDAFDLTGGLTYWRNQYTDGCKSAPYPVRARDCIDNYS